MRTHIPARPAHKMYLHLGAILTTVLSIPNTLVCYFTPWRLGSLERLKGSVALLYTMNSTPLNSVITPGLHFPSPNFSIYYFEMHTPQISFYSSPFSIYKTHKNLVGVCKTYIKRAKYRYFHNFDSTIKLLNLLMLYVHVSNLLCFV